MLIVLGSTLIVLGSIGVFVGIVIMANGVDNMRSTIVDQATDLIDMRRECYLKVEKICELTTENSKLYKRIDNLNTIKTTNIDLKYENEELKSKINDLEEVKKQSKLSSLTKRRKH